MSKRLGKRITKEDRRRYWKSPMGRRHSALKQACMLVVTKPYKQRVLEQLSREGLQVHCRKCGQNVSDCFFEDTHRCFREGS